MKIPLLWLILIAFPSPIENPVFKITERSRAHHPGEVLRITLSTTIQFSDVSIEGWGRKFLAFKQEGEDWEALVGIDLSAKPGDYQLKIQGVSQAGPNYSQTLDLKVEVKEFPTRRLTVDPKFVSPPQEQLARIRRESRLLSSIFSKASGRPQWSDGFLSPVPGAANSGFGKRSIFNGQPRSPHSGTDFDVDSGTPVASPNAGKSCSSRISTIRARRSWLTMDLGCIPFLPTSPPIVSQWVTSSLGTRSLARWERPGG